MRTHVLLNLLNEFKFEACSFAKSLINSTIQEHECKILFIICPLNYFENERIFVIHVQVTTVVNTIISKPQVVYRF